MKDIVSIIVVIDYEVEAELRIEHDADVLDFILDNELCFSTDRENMIQAMQKLQSIINLSGPAE